MKTVYESRAAAVLFNLAKSIDGPAGVFLVPANVCPSVPLAILTAGHLVEFVDISIDSLCIDEGRLLQRIAQGHRKRVVGIIYVRTYGIEDDATLLFGRIKKANGKLLLIDDRCLCRPEPDADRIDPQGADAVVFSTGYGKYVELAGGGFAHIVDAIPYERHDRSFSPSALDAVTTAWRQHRINGTPLPIAANGRESVLPSDWHDWLATTPPDLGWDAFRKKLLAARHEGDAQKQRLNDFYLRTLPTKVQLPPAYQNWRFNILVQDKEALMERIFSAGAFASGHYYPASRLFGASRCPTAEAIFGQVVNLFNDLHFDDRLAQVTSDVVMAHLRCRSDTNAEPIAVRP